MEYSSQSLIRFASDLAAERDLRKSALVDVVEDCKKSERKRRRGIFAFLRAKRLIDRHPFSKACQ